MTTSPIEEGDCIICGSKTANRSRGGTGRGRYSHWRCPSEEHDQCSDRRDMRRRRPRHRAKGLDEALAAVALLKDADREEAGA